MKKRELLKQLSASGKTLEEVITCSDGETKCFEGEQLSNAIRDAVSVEDFIGMCEEKKEFDASTLQMQATIVEAAAMAANLGYTMGNLLEMCVEAYLVVTEEEGDQEEAPRDCTLN